MALVMAKPRLARCAPGRSVAGFLRRDGLCRNRPEARPPHRVAETYMVAPESRNKTRLITGLAPTAGRVRCPAPPRHHWRRDAGAAKALAAWRRCITWMQLSLRRVAFPQTSARRPNGVRSTSEWRPNGVRSASAQGPATLQRPQQLRSVVPRRADRQAIPATTHLEQGGSNSEHKGQAATGAVMRAGGAGRP